MTRIAWTLVVVFGGAFVFAVSLGGQYIGDERWLAAAGAYGVAVLFLAGMVREIGRTMLPGDYTDDIDTPVRVKGAGPRARLHARREARRLMRSMPCGCERYWSSVGAQHDPWCPQFYRSVA